MPEAAVPTSAFERLWDECLLISIRHPASGSLIQRRHGFGISFAPHLRNLFRLSKMQAVSRTHRHACGFQADVDSILAVIALNHLAGFRIPLGGAPWAGGHARLAPDTEVFINKNNAVFRTFLHGPGGTSRYAPWIFTVKTRHKSVRCFGEFTHKLWTDGDDLANFGADRKVFVALASNLTAVAADAFLCVLK